MRCQPAEGLRLSMYTPAFRPGSNRYSIYTQQTRHYSSIKSMVLLLSMYFNPIYTPGHIPNFTCPIRDYGSFHVGRLRWGRSYRTSPHPMSLEGFGYIDVVHQLSSTVISSLVN